MQIGRTIGWVGVFLFCAMAVFAGVPESSLACWKSEQPVALKRFQGMVVVLDFFAPWCPPCAEASPQLEAGISAYYRHRGGNPLGVPVALLGINVDDEAPAEVERFIAETGMELVLNDAEGRWFDQFGGKALPLIVVLDLSRPDGVPVELYRAEGLEDVAVLRGVIDGVGAPLASQDEGIPPRIRNDYQLEGFVELLSSADLVLSEAGLEARMERAGRSYRLGVTQGDIELDFVSPDTILQDVSRNERRSGLQAQVQWPIAETMELQLGGSGYSGYADYRSLWLDEYYRQQYGSLPGYQTAHPQGYGVSAGIRWAYRPGLGYVTATLGARIDRFSPAYEPQLTFPITLERAQDRYETFDASLAFENVFSRRLRALQEIRASETTDRATRWAIKSGWNMALAEPLVFRINLSGSREGDTLSAYALQGTLEYDWNARWFLGITGGMYEDAGQFEPTLAGDTSAPALRSWLALLSLRFQGQRTALKLAAGPYSSTYLETPDNEFRTLYRDRDWFHLNLALSYRL